MSTQSPMSTQSRVSTQSIDALLSGLWADYVTIAPHAARIRSALESRGETVVNDHVALRGLGRVGLGLEALARPFETLGWTARADYRFDDKHLVARYWQHPDPSLPKLFISELCLEELSPSAQHALEALAAQVTPEIRNGDSLCRAGRPWPIAQATYHALLEESEYAAWVAAFGFRVNHFTVDVRQLQTIASLAAMNEWLRTEGFPLSMAGGVIKGSAGAGLEQSSTRAEEVDVDFTDGTLRIPSCYYEMAYRHPGPDGTLFQGFVPRSANRLFESTDTH